MSGTIPGRWVDLPAGHRFPNWTVVGHLAEGSMASVYEARYSGLRRAELPALAALKITTAALAPDGSERAREYDLARRLAGHPNVVAVHDVFDADTPESGRCVVLVTELADESLHDRIRRAGPLPACELEVLAGQVAAGIAALHRAGIIHGDLKPANILSFPTGWKLADFGTAAVGYGRGHLSWSGGATFNGGTFWYSTPERADALLAGAAPPAIDRAADIWAFGVLLHEAATGRRPFANGAALLAGSVAIEGSLPPALAEVIAACLVTGCERLGDGSELVEMLARHGLAGAEPPTWRVIPPRSGPSPDPPPGTRPAPVRVAPVRGAPVRGGPVRPDPAVARPAVGGRPALRRIALLATGLVCVAGLVAASGTVARHRSSTGAAAGAAGGLGGTAAEPATVAADPATVIGATGPGPGTVGADPGSVTVGAPDPATTVAGTTDGPWIIRNATSGKCLEVNDFSLVEGLVIDQWDCKGTEHRRQANELWFRDWIDTSTFRLRSAFSAACMSLLSDTPAAGDVIVQSRCGNRATGLFRWEGPSGASRPYGTLRLATGGEARYLTVSSGSGSNGADLILRPRTPGGSQEFVFTD